MTNYVITEQMRESLLSAGFTDKQINQYRIKFYNLLATMPEPMPMKEIEQCPRCGFKQWKENKR